MIPLRTSVVIASTTTFCSRTGDRPLRGDIAAEATFAQRIAPEGDGPREQGSVPSVEQRSVVSTEFTDEGFRTEGDVGFACVGVIVFVALSITRKDALSSSSDNPFIVAVPCLLKTD
jgi:hypothetical protein